MLKLYFRRTSLSFFTPAVFVANLRFLFRRKIVLDVEGLANVFWRLPLNHTGNGGACQIEEWLDIHKVSGQDKIEESFLFYINVFRIPLLYHVGHVGGFQGFFNFGHWVFRMLLEEFHHLLQYRGLDIRDRNFKGGFVITFIWNSATKK